MIKYIASSIVSFSLILSLLLAISTGGCYKKSADHEDFSSLIATELVKNKDATPNLTPVKKFKRSECPKPPNGCGGTGYITSGDGLFRQECPYCVPDFKEEPHNNTFLLQPPQLKVPCCVHCNCAEGDCFCAYPGECLVKANGNQPVTKWDVKNKLWVTYRPNQQPKFQWAAGDPKLAEWVKKWNAEHPNQLLKEYDAQPVAKPQPQPQPQYRNQGGRVRGRS